MPRTATQVATRSRTAHSTRSHSADPPLLLSLLKFNYHRAVSRVPTFHTSRLTLRELVEADAVAYERYFADYNVIRTMASSVPWPYPTGGVLTYLHSEILPKQGNDKWVWAITEKENPAELIGAVDLWRVGRPEHRGFWLAHKHWGKGYMTEAVEPVIDFAFDQLGFEKLVFTNAIGNFRSRRVKEKTGATRIGTAPATFVDPTLTEREFFELTKAGWQRFKKLRGPPSAHNSTDR